MPNDGHYQYQSLPQNGNMPYTHPAYPQPVYPQSNYPQQNYQVSGNVPRPPYDDRKYIYY